MAIQIPGDDLSALNVFFDSLDVKNFFARSPEEQLSKEFVYFARYGKSFDGHKFALQIIRSKNFIVGEKEHILNCFPNSRIQKEILESEYFIEVSHVESALIREMKNFALINDLNFKSVGVTGTSGKTSVVQLTGQILSSFQKILKIGTLGIEIDGIQFPNSHLTTPDYPAFINALAYAQNANINTLIMEVSSHGLAQSRLADYQFDVAVFTNFSQDHLDFHESMQEYLEAKTLLFSKHLKLNGTCIISTQSPEWIHIMRNCIGSERTLYLLLNDNDDAVFSQIRNDAQKFKNIYFLKIEDKTSTFDGLSGAFNLLDLNKNLISHDLFTTPLIGEANFENIMNAYCISLSLGYPIKKFMKFFANLHGIPGRMEKVRGLIPQSSHEMTVKDTPLVIVDYSHKPGALESVLKTLRNLLSPGKKLITVFGCGGDRDKSKRPAMGHIASILSDTVIVTSDNPRTEEPDKIIHQIVSGMTQSSTHFIEPDRRLAIQMAFKIAKKSDIILIAGKGHETYQIIGNQKIEFSDVKVAEEFLRDWIGTQKE